MTGLQERAVVALWASGLFDTAEMAAVVGAPECDVERLTRAAREVARAERAVAAVVLGDAEGAA